MNKKLTKGLAQASLLMLLTSHAAVATPSKGNSNQVSTMTQSTSQSMASSTRSFGLDLFRKLADKSGENCFISPTSVAIALNLALAGAQGKTKDAMAKGLHLADSKSNTADAVRQLISDLQSQDAKVEFNIANAVFVEDKFKLNDSYLQTAKQNFHSEVRNEDFAKPDAVKHINAWVSEKTKGHIPSIISKLSPGSVAVLLNAIYFHGQWTTPFVAKNTQDKDFHLADGTTKKMPMMSRSGKFSYFEEADFQAVELPYGSERFNAYVILPAQSVKLSEFQKKLTAENWDKWMDSFTSWEHSSLTLPKFHIDFSSNLNEALAALGFAEMFADSANFSAMHTPPPALKVSQVIHKTTLDVDEQGTVATAATAVVMMATAMRMEPKHFSMVVDRPFIFAIRDSQTGMLIFVGTVYKPELLKS